VSGTEPAAEDDKGSWSASSGRGEAPAPERTDEGQRKGRDKDEDADEALAESRMSDGMDARFNSFDLGARARFADEPVDMFCDATSERTNGARGE
jgi:hypothetical protein